MVPSDFGKGVRGSILLNARYLVLLLLYCSSSWCGPLNDTATGGNETFLFEDANGTTTDDILSEETTTISPGGVLPVVSIRWDYVSAPFICTSFVIIAGLAKISFHHAESLSHLLPESCLLIILGTIVGLLLYLTGSIDVLPEFSANAFFLYLLPPIILDSSYSLHDAAFFNNLPTILLYAVVGTIMNSLLVGLLLHALSVIGGLGKLPITLTECLLFGTLISAVDPVAVLAIFQDLGVNKTLYFLVFGESLLNDAVTVVLYTMMAGFNDAGAITLGGAALGVVSFFIVSLGALGIGILMGILTALITKHTSTLKVVEPLAMLGVAYFSYLLAEIFHFSGIVSIMACGLVQAQYATKNISEKSNVTVKYFTRMASSVCDTTIFLFLGLVLVNENHVWRTGFICWSTVLCLVIRFVNVFSLTYLANAHDHVRWINFEEQFIMAYGGLRGAVAFSLVIMMRECPNKHLFVTTTLFIILFTVFFLGGTMKPLVQLFQIRGRAEKKKSLFSEINAKVVENIVAGVDEIVGWQGASYWKILVLFRTVNDKHLTRWLQVAGSKHQLTLLYDKVVLAEHYANLYGPATVIEKKQNLELLHDKEVESGIEEGNESTEEKVPEEPKPKRRTRRVRAQDAEMGGRFGERGGGGGGLRRQRTILGIVTHKKEEPEDEEADVLLEAIKNNPYNKRFYKYNPNLVSESQQDLSSHLKARRARARRLSMVVAPDQARNPSLKALDIFKERAEHRRSLRRKRSGDGDLANIAEEGTIKED